jgi:hypothetical protein
MKYVLYFTLRAILQMFKFIPDEFLLTFCCCRQKVSRTACGRRAGYCVKKAMEGGKRQRLFLAV